MVPTDVFGSNRGEKLASTPEAGTAGIDSLYATVPRLPRVYVPRARLWQRLDQATQNPLTLLVAPGGAGKTLGVSGWLRRSRRSTEPTWLHADRSWTPGRLEALLDSAAGTGQDTTPGPRLVVVDDAHALPPSTLRMIDSRLNEAPLDMRLLLLSRWDLPLARLVPELLGSLHDPSRRASAHGSGRVRGAGHRARADGGPSRAPGGLREDAGMVRPRRPDGAGDRHRPGPHRGRRPVRRRRGRRGGPGRDGGLRGAPAAGASPPAVPGRRGDREHRHRTAPVPRLPGRRDPLRAGDHRTPREPAAVRARAPTRSVG